jgi:hypothetical protein
VQQKRRKTSTRAQIQVSSSSLTGRTSLRRPHKAKTRKQRFTRDRRQNSTSALDKNLYQKKKVFFATK